MGHLQGGADIVAPTWTADVRRLKMLVLSSPLDGTFGPSIRQGIAEPNFPFSGSEKLPVDTEIGDALILLALGTEKGAKHKANICPQTFLPSSVTSVMIKALSWRDPVTCSCSVQDLRSLSLMWKPGRFLPFLVILTPITSFSCYLRLLLTSQSSSLVSSWCCSKSQYCRGDFFGSILFLDGLCLSCFLSSCSRLSHVDLVMEDPLMEKWEEGILKQ